MIHKVKLIVRDEERWLTSVSYGYHIKFSDAPDIDKIIQLHQEVALQLGSEQVLPIEGGFLRLRFSSTDHDQFFYDWLFTSMMEEGDIELLQNEVEAISRISFWDCYCVGVEEWMSADGAPMGIELLLSPAILKKDAPVHEKIWKITDIHGNTEVVKATEEEDETKDEAKIISLEIIDKTNQPVSGKILQYVNIKKNDSFVDGEIVKGLHQLGNVVRAKVLFNKPGQHPFTLKLSVANNSLSYSEKEKRTNPHFKYQEKTLSLTTDSHGAKIIEGDLEVFLSQAGNCLYNLSATDNFETKVKSISTERLLYYMEIRMKGLDSITSNLNIFTEEYKKHGITFIKLPFVEIEHIPNIGNDVEKALLKKEVAMANSVQKGSTKEPYTISIVYTDQLAIMKEQQQLAPFYIAKGGPAIINIPITDERKKLHPLWIGLSPNVNWFVKCFFTEDGSYKQISIPQDKCTAVQVLGKAKSCCASVNVDVSHLANKSGFISLVVNWVDHFRSGIALEGNNIAVITTRTYWHKVIETEQNAVMIHEVGHLIGMASDGSVLDKVPCFYTKRGHRGKHCHKGIGLLPDYNGAKGAICVMFGEVSGNSAFCPDCANSVKKVDLSNGIKKNDYPQLAEI